MITNYIRSNPIKIIVTTSTLATLIVSAYFLQMSPNSCGLMAVTATSASLFVSLPLFNHAYKKYTLKKKIKKMMTEEASKEELAKFEAEYFQKLKEGDQAFGLWLSKLINFSENNFPSKKHLNLLTSMFSDGTTIFFGWVRNATTNNWKQIPYRGFMLWVLTAARKYYSPDKLKEFVEIKDKNNNKFYTLEDNHNKNIKFMLDYCFAIKS